MAVNTGMFSSDKPLSKTAYIVGLVVIFLAVYSQYFVNLKQIIPLGAATGYVVVYGIPAIVVTVLLGKYILARAAKNNKKATELGLGLFGAFTLLGLFLAIVAFIIIQGIDPNTSNLLSKPNPVLDVSSSQAWILIAVSMLVVGPAEEYIFRGFMYGGLLNLTGGKHWLPLAIVSSLMFTAVHAYYAVTYQIASVLAFIQLTVFGIAMGITYYWSGGNILVPALIHGVYDATGFLGVATNTTIGTIARFVFIGVGLVFAVIYLTPKLRLTFPQQTTGGSQNPPPPPDPSPPSTP